jgi:Zn-dependent peptidase ImmA (M78 family)
MRRNMPLPSSVKIGPQTFKIEFRDPAKDGMLNDGSHGYTLEAGNLIVVSKSIDISKQRVTLMHEMLHACKYVFDTYSPAKKDLSDPDDIEHLYISVYENAILMIIQDNPEIIDWLTDTDD